MDRILTVRAVNARLFWPYDEVALLWEEGTGRTAAIHRSGKAGHTLARPSALHGPWIEAKPTVWVHPAHARWVADTWGFTLRDPSFLRPAPDSVMPGTDVRREEVLGVGNKGRATWWITDRGNVPFQGSFFAAVRMHGDLIRVGNARWINRRRVRSFEFSPQRTCLRLDSGEEIGCRWGSTGTVRRRLGLPRRAHDEGWTHAHDVMFSLDLRDWPFDLVRASAGQLKALFGGDGRRIVAHVLWQTVRWRQLGRAAETPDTTRGYYYRLIIPVMSHAGQRPVELFGRRPVIGREYDNEALYHLFLETLALLIGDYAVFTYADLGFVDLHPERRGVGAVHPGVVIVCEKTSSADTCRRLAARFGASFAVHDGAPQLSLSERLAAEIPAGVPVKVVAFVDFDHAGWIIADAFVNHLERYGRQATLAGHLVTPARFTPDEIALYARPLTSKAQIERTKIRNWVKRSDGIDGLPRGIHANHLRPYERVEAAFVELTGLAARDRTPSAYNAP